MKYKIKIADILNAFELGLIDIEQTESKLFDLFSVGVRSEQFFAFLKWAKQADMEYPNDMLLDDFERFDAKH